MSDHSDRQAPYAFSNAYKKAVKSKYYQEGMLPDAHDGVSTQVMRAVWRCYADHADHDDGHSSWPSHGTVSTLTGCSRRQVQRAVAALTDLGWLIKTCEATKTTAATYTVSLRGMDNTSTHDTLSPDNTSTHDNTSIDDITPCHLTTRHEVTPRPMGIDTTSYGYRQGGTLPYQEPYQRPVVDAREGAVSTNTPQQVEEDQEQPLVVDYDEQDRFVAVGVEIGNILLDLYGKHASCEHGDLFVQKVKVYDRICPRLSTPEGVMEFFEDQRLYWKSAQASGLEGVPKTAHHFITKCASQTAVEMFQRRRAPIWESEANSRFERAEADRIDRERREREEWEKNAPPRRKMTQAEIDASNPFLFDPMYAKTGDDQDEAC